MPNAIIFYPLYGTERIECARCKSSTSLRMIGRQAYRAEIFPSRSEVHETTKLLCQCCGFVNEYEGTTLQSEAEKDASGVEVW